MSIHYPENQFRPSLNVSGLNDSNTLIDVLYNGAESRLSLDDLKKQGLNL